MDEQRAEEHLPVTSGRWTGVLGVLAGLGVAAAALPALPALSALAILVGGVLFALLVFAAVLRPRVSLVGDTLVLRGMVDTVHLPLAAVEELAVRQVLAVRVGGRRYVSSAVGRSWRTLARTRASAAGERRAVHEGMAPVDYVEERIRAAVDDARTSAGVHRGSPEQQALASGTRRIRSWPLAAALAGLAGLLVVLGVVQLA